MTTKRKKNVSVCLEEQRDSFLKYKQLFRSVKNFPSSESNVYKEVSKDLSHRMTPKALYLSVKRHFVKFFGDLKHEKSSSSSIDSNNVNEDASSSDESIKNVDSESFEIELDLWHEVKPELRIAKRNDPKKPTVKYQSRRYMPKSKWTSIFQQWIWQRTTNKCIWHFKNHSVTDDYHVTCRGTCKVCNGKIVIITRRNDMNVLLECSFDGVDKDMIHSSQVKNKLTAHKKNQLIPQLQNQYPIVLRNKLANITMQNETRDPPFNPNLKYIHT